MDDINSQALKLHRKSGGKLEIKSKVPLRNCRDLALAYTPGVAKVAREIFKNQSLAKICTIKKNVVAVVTDGSAILGLGNLGPLAALPIMEGKCILFKAFAGVDAWPICLDTQDTESIIAVVKHIAPVFGGINLEDIAAPRCFAIEQRLKQELDIPVLHDDQHGTAVVVLAALLNALKLKKLSKAKAKVVISGAGAAGTGIAELLTAVGFKNLIVCDSQGAIYKKRPGLTAHKKRLAELTNKKFFKGSLAEALRQVDVFIGVSVKNILTPKMVRSMNFQPIIFALANPLPEINPSLAKQAGAFIVATGGSDFPNQLNNALAFPGIFRGALDHKIRNITQKMLILAAKNLAASTKNLSPGHILPDLFDRKAAVAVASAIR
jgi:malate dehydrogenase (oxaloacetate-decarboxylating)